MEDANAFTLPTGSDQFIRQCLVGKEGFRAVFLLAARTVIIDLNKDLAQRSSRQSPGKNTYMCVCAHINVYTNTYTDIYKFK